MGADTLCAVLVLHEAGSCSESVCGGGVCRRPPLFRSWAPPGLLLEETSAECGVIYRVISSPFVRQWRSKYFHPTERGLAPRDATGFVREYRVRPLSIRSAAAHAVPKLKFCGAAAPKRIPEPAWHRLPQHVAASCTSTSADGRVTTRRDRLHGVSLHLNLASAVSPCRLLMSTAIGSRQEVHDK